MSSSRDLVSAARIAACSSGGQLALRANRLKDSTTAVLEFAEVAQAFVELTELGVVQRPGGFLAVPGDERDGGPAVEQFHGGFHLPRFDAKFSGNLGVDGAVRVSADDGADGACGSWVTRTFCLTGPDVSSGAAAAAARGPGIPLRAAKCCS